MEFVTYIEIKQMTIMTERLVEKMKEYYGKGFIQYIKQYNITRSQNVIN